jgi:hypothetical protein
MPTITTSSGTPCVQWLIERRPPGLTWSRPSPSQPNQPPLDLTDREPDVAEAAATNDRGGVSISRCWASVRSLKRMAQKMA